MLKLVSTARSEEKKVFWTQWTARTEVIPPQGLRIETRESERQEPRELELLQVARGEEETRLSQDNNQDKYLITSDP